MKITDNTLMPATGLASDEHETSGYEAVRLNALKHGILSRQIVLPHEDTEEFDNLRALLVAEHQPNGVTELHLVEELAGIIWRKRRILLAEGAKINRGVRISLHSLNGNPSATVKNAVPTEYALAGAYVDFRDLVSTTQEDLQKREKEACRDLEATEKAGQILRENKKNAYEKALKTLLVSSQTWWQDKLENGEVQATSGELKDFISIDLLPACRSTLAEIQHHEAIKRQVIGEGTNMQNMENLTRYETHLDRKFERTLAMLIKLRDIRNGK